LGIRQGATLTYCGDDSGGIDRILHHRMRDDAIAPDALGVAEHDDNVVL
jgi:hypothetical protein